ncbi:hypothetical protein O1611_g5245 [Lasiodiplodia mahajangana]|uniref:Uncharacterized protein n=1 Tax=Lasiodiplodia mahajangana TaxID=1108764 RepID=A0ACC2JLK1_9PEZI|nr:hypothetical protein O1611_g5245 [Lasiodiplodia mahajangana]
MSCPHRTGPERQDLFIPPNYGRLLAMEQAPSLKRQRDEELTASRIHHHRHHHHHHHHPIAPPTKIPRLHYPDSGYCDQEPPEFWDNLPTVPLVSRALEVYNRRTLQRPEFPSPVTIGVQDLTITSELLELASNGGPDLTNLRGYPNPLHTMAGSHVLSDQSFAICVDYQPPGEQHMANHGITLHLGAPYPEWNEVNTAILNRNYVLSYEMFETVRDLDFGAKDEEDIKANVIPHIIGTSRDALPSRNIEFNNIITLTDGSPAAVRPNLYYGADPRALPKQVRDTLAGYIVPDMAAEKPIAPNFFLQTKGPSADLSAAVRQACYEGAIGARGMHYLQNYGSDLTVYDPRPLSFSAIYHYGVLRIYAHYTRAPRDVGATTPEYHMTPIGTYLLTSTHGQFVEGICALRNIRDLARGYRDVLIATAKDRHDQYQQQQQEQQEQLAYQQLGHQQLGHQQMGPNI